MTPDIQNICYAGIILRKNSIFVDTIWQFIFKSPQTFILHLTNRVETLDRQLKINFVQQFLFPNQRYLVSHRN